VDLVRLTTEREILVVLLVRLCPQMGDLLGARLDLRVYGIRSSAKGNGELVLRLGPAEAIIDRAVEVADVFGNDVLLRLDLLEFPRGAHGRLQLVEELVFFRKREGGRLLPHLQPASFGPKSLQIGGGRGPQPTPELSLHLDEMPGLSLKPVPLRTVGPQVPQEPSALGSETPDLGAQGSPFVIEQVPFLSDRGGLGVEGVAPLP